MIYYSKYEPIFGSWHITEELGTGAEGHLYRISREDALGHVFYSALKAVSIPAGGEPELVSLIAGGMSREEAIRYFDTVLEGTSQEFELLEKLKGNSNIVSYEDHEAFRRDDGIGWDVLIRMEELTPLVRYSVYNRMDEADITRMGADIARALVLCRKYGIVHRDIKPENIFISPAGSYKLGDFGIARIIDDTASSLSRKGTYKYMAPEVYWGKKYGHTADIYSLGMVMYSFLNDGRMPFMPKYPEPIGYRDGEAAFTKRVGGTEIDPPRNGSDELKAVIRRACAYNAEDRYSDAAEMLRDIEAIQRGEPLAASSPAAGRSSSPGRQENGNKPHRARRIAAILAALCLLIAGIAYAMIPKEVSDIDCGEMEGGVEIYIGEELTPKYSVLPDRFSDEPVTAVSDSADIVNVTEDGSLQALSLGEAVLKVSAKEYSEEITVRVVPKVTAIEGIDRDIKLTTGDTLELIPILEPEEFASEPVTYRVKDKSVASVSDDGILTAVSAGATKLTVSAGGTDLTAKITVSDPVVYVPPYSGTSSGKTSASKTKKKSGSGKASKGYFDSDDDEEF